MVISEGRDHLRSSVIEGMDPGGTLGCEQAKTTMKKTWLCSVDLVIQQLYITTV
jgi:hypothetical protein